MMMQVLALAGFDRDLKHPHLTILMQQAVVGRRATSASRWGGQSVSSVSAMRSPSDEVARA
jgi:hypothetical protein